MLYKTAITLATLLLATHVSADSTVEEIDFSNPTSVYSAVEVSAGSDGVAAGLSLSGAINEDWAFLSKAEVREDGDMFRVRGAAISNGSGTGVMLDYIKHDDFHGDIEDSKSETLVLNAMQVLPFNEGKTMIVPIVGVGYTDNDFASSKANIWMVQTMIIQNWTDSIWTNVSPKWTNSFSDMEMKHGAPDQRIKSFDLELIAGYRFGGNQNVRLHITEDDSNETEAWLAYTRAF